MKKYKDLWYSSADGLRLYARDYNPGNGAKTILCLPGLTRNSADFSRLADHLSSRYRVIAADLRGRGRSQYDPNPRNYHPGVYAEDVMALLDAIPTAAATFIGSSLGGIVSMLVAARCPARVDAVVLNDIGPEINMAGMDRIRRYVCNAPPVGSWSEAIDNTRLIHGSEYPDFGDQDWAVFARNLYRVNGDGAPVLDYDPEISFLLRESNASAPVMDLWPVFDAIKAIPTLLVRGGLSDIITPAVVKRMRESKPDLNYVELQNRGHAPLLTEPECLAAIDKLLDSCGAKK